MTVSRHHSGPWLLPAGEVAATGPVDHPGWNYRPVVGVVQRVRFRVLVELLAGDRFRRLLEVGYGSGVFLPELARHCTELYGVDPHDHADRVAAVVRRHGVEAALARGTAEELRFETGWFDCVVAVSALEYVPDLEAACREIRRVLVPGGVLAVVTPGATRLWDPLLRVATRQGPGQYGDRRQRLQPLLRRHFQLARQVRVPIASPAAVRLYTGLRLEVPHRR